VKTFGPADLLTNSSLSVEPGIAKTVASPVEVE